MNYFVFVFLVRNKSNLLLCKIGIDSNMADVHQNSAEACEDSAVDATLSASIFSELIDHISSDLGNLNHKTSHEQTSNVEAKSVLQNIDNHETARSFNDILVEQNSLTRQAIVTNTLESNLIITDLTSEPAQFELNNKVDNAHSEQEDVIMLDDEPSPVDSSDFYF